MPHSAQYLIAVLMIAWPLASVTSAFEDDIAKPRRIDPAAWGDDHVGKPFPSYITGDECLFCHRKIGPTWGDNRHQLTIRTASSDDSAIVMLRELSKGNEIVAETRYLMGTQRITRFLRRSKDYGKLDILSTSFVPKKKNRGDGEKSRVPKIGDLKNLDPPVWDKKTFGARCAGCHATAVNVQTQAFSAISLDCVTCHGDVELGHTKDVGRVLLSSKSREPRRIVSICGQCHLRGGKSKSSGLPYPNTFIAGDNLFRDFQVDFSDAAIGALPTVDQHIYFSARDVTVFDQSEMTCLTCHDVHGQSTEKHQQLDNRAICKSCHVAGTDNTKLQNALLVSNRLRTHSRVCDY